MKKLLIALLMLASQATWAQNIVAVTGTNVGGGVDYILRNVLKRYDELYGTTSIVVNKPGAEGKVALNYFNDLPAGTVKILGTSQGHVLNYNAEDFNSLIPVAESVVQPFILIARKDFPADNWDQYVAYVNKNPEKVSMGVTTRPSTYPWLIPVLEKNKMKINMIHQGSQDLHIDVASGVMDSMWTSPPSVLGTGVESRVKIIAMTSTLPVDGIDSKVYAGNNPRLGTVWNRQGWFTSNAVDAETRRVLSERIQGIFNSKWAEENISKKGARAGGSIEHLMSTYKKDWVEWQKHKPQQ